MNSFLKYTILTSIFLIPFIPFVVIKGMFFPFITGKNFAFRIIVEIIFGLWAILALRDSNYRPKNSSILMAFTAFVAIIGLADFFGENPARSFWSNYERMEGWVTLIHLLAYFVVLASMMTHNLWRRLFDTSLFASFLMCIFSFFQLAGVFEINQGGARVDGTLGNATYLAIYMVFHMFIAAMISIRPSTMRPTRIIYSILMFLQAIVLYHTATRGAILGLIGGTFLTALIIGVLEKERRALKKYSLAIIASVVILLGLFVAIKNTSFVMNSPVLSRFSSISLSSGVTDARIYVWGMAINGFKEHPILGWGQENFNYVFNEYFDPHMYNQEPWFDRTHDVFFDWLIVGGILGLFGYLSLYGFGLYAIWRKGDLSLGERAVVTGLFAAYLFHNIFVFDNLVSYLMFVMVLAYLHDDVARPFSERVQKFFEALFSSEKVRDYVVSPIIVVLILVTIYGLNWKPVMANTKLIDVMTSDPKSTVQSRLSTFKEALAYETFGDQEIREQLIQFAFSARNANISLTDKQAIFNLASEEYKKMVKDIPNDARHHLFLGILYEQYGAYADAEKELKRAQELSPKKQNILLELGDLYVKMGNYSSAMDSYKKAYDQGDYDNEARLAYAASAVYLDQDDLVSQLLLPKFGTVDFPDDRLLQAYLAGKKYNHIVSMWQNQVKAKPQVSRNHVALAAAYLQAGNRAAAINEVQNAISIETDKATKAQYEQVLQELKAGRSAL